MNEDRQAARDAAELLRDATVRLDEQRKMTDRAEAATAARVAEAVDRERAAWVAKIKALQAANDEDRYLPGFHYKAQILRGLLSADDTEAKR